MSKLNQIWIFQDLYHVSDYYHSEGGLVVVAKDEEEAKYHIGKYNDIKVPDEAWADALTGETTLSVRVIAFPDSGCC